MTINLFGFTGQNNPDQSYATGLQQYLQQGQMGINPGQQQVAASDPISSAGAVDFGKALRDAFNSGPPGAQPPTTPEAQQAAYATLGMGAAALPNSPSGENMGGVGPTIKNASALQNPDYQAKLAALLQGVNY